MARPKIDRDVNMSDATSKRQLLAELAPLAGLYAVEVKPIRPTRSGQANRYYWGVVVRAFHDFLREQGETYTDEDCHEFLKCKFLLQSLVNKNTGELIGRAPRSTASLTVQEFGDYLERCIHWLQDMFGIVVPEAGEYTRRPETANSN